MFTPIAHWQSRKRWERDRLLLEKEFSRRPDDPRTVFYLAQTWVQVWSWVLALQSNWQIQNINFGDHKRCTLNFWDPIASKKQPPIGRATQKWNSYFLVGLRFHAFLISSLSLSLLSLPHFWFLRYGSLSLHELAIDMYTKRIAITHSWNEETYIARYRRAQHMQWLGRPWHEVQDKWKGREMEEEYISYVNHLL